HFIQKLEDEPELEFRAMHRELEHLKTGPNNTERLQRWQEGQTGWPLVDACMRSLEHTGWINFRMRAMLMAVASYQLWLHWRDPTLDTRAGWRPGGNDPHSVADDTSPETSLWWQYLYFTSL